MMKQDLLEIERLIDRGETAVALPMLEQAVTREPGHAAARLLLARALEVDGRFGDAVTAWRLVRALVPDSPTAATGLKRALRLRMLWSADPGSWTVLVPAAPDTATPPPAAVPADGEPAWEDVLEGVDQIDDAPPEEAAAEPRAEAATASGEVAEPPAEPASPEEAADRPAGATDHAGTWDSETQNLDELIRDLEAARIVPDPAIPPADPEDLETDVDDVVSETLARIYENQRHFDEAARVWERLAVQQPDRADEFRLKADEARARAGS